MPRIPGLFLYPLKTSEILWFSVFKGYRKTPVASNGLKRVDDDDCSKLLERVRFLSSGTSFEVDFDLVK